MTQRRIKGLGEIALRIHDLPVKVKHMGTFPVRAFGLVEEPE